MTFRGPAEKFEFEPLSYENLVFAVQGGPRIAPNFDVFSEGRSGGSVLRSETPKMPTEADFGGFRSDSGAPFGPIFGTFRGPNFDRVLIYCASLLVMQDNRFCFWKQIVTLEFSTNLSAKIRSQIHDYSI